jgi:hypothetical protein
MLCYDKSLLWVPVLPSMPQFLIGSVLSVILWISGAVKAPKLDAQTVGAVSWCWCWCLSASTAVLSASTVVLSASTASSCSLMQLLMQPSLEHAGLVFEGRFFSF